MDQITRKIYNTIFKNSILFLNKGIEEIVKDNSIKFDHNQAIVSCLFIQMTLELGLKAFLVKESGVKTILVNKYHNRNIHSIFNSFNQNTLKTKTYNELKKNLKDNNELTWFTDNHYRHIDKFQLFRNNLVHINLFFKENELKELKHELIYVIVHILIPLLTEISFEFESPTEFYSKHLDNKQHRILISFPPYIKEMERIAKEYTGLAYECPKCYNWTFSPVSKICYCCNLNFIDAAEYINCNVCGAAKSVIFDSLNIKLNNNIINGLCLNCGDKPSVFKCPECDEKITFNSLDELINTCYAKCKNE